MNGERALVGRKEGGWVKNLTRGYSPHFPSALLDI